jgi:hypothetical protein
MAEKKLSFKDFLTVDYAPGMDPIIKKNAKKRKTETSSVGESVDVNEVLNTQQRLKQGRRMKRFSSRIEIGRKKAMKRMANLTVIGKRSKKAARTLMFQKLTKGIAKADLSMARRADIEKRMDKPALKARIEKLAKRMIPKTRKKELDRHRGK